MFVLTCVSFVGCTHSRTIVASEPGDCFRLAAGYGLGGHHGMGGRAFLNLSDEVIEVVDVDDWGVDSLYYTSPTSDGYATVVAAESTFVALRLDRQPLRSYPLRGLVVQSGVYAGGLAGFLLVGGNFGGDGASAWEYTKALGGMMLGIVVGFVSAHWASGRVHREEVCRVAGQ